MSERGEILAKAWKKYEWLFHAVPHGTPQQMSALLELAPELFVNEPGAAGTAPTPHHELWHFLNYHAEAGRGMIEFGHTEEGDIGVWVRGEHDCAGHGSDAKEALENFLERSKSVAEARASAPPEQKVETDGE